MHKPYFPKKEGHPLPLRAEFRRRVRFEEVDPLGIVWHGRYPSYFEDARTALGDKYCIGYNILYQHGVVTPIRQFHIDYFASLRFDQEFVIEGIQHYSESARINTEYVIRDSYGKITTRGYTVQMFLDLEGNILIDFPDFFAAFAERWKRDKL